MVLVEPPQSDVKMPWKPWERSSKINEGQTIQGQTLPEKLTDLTAKKHLKNSRRKLTPLKEMNEFFQASIFQVRLLWGKVGILKV